MKSHRILAALFLLSVTVSVPASAEGQLRFAKIFTNHMVLQQDKPVKIWGWATPGAEVTVLITEDEAVAQPMLQDWTKKIGSEYTVSMHYVEENAPKFDIRTDVTRADGKGAWEIMFPGVKGGFKPKFIVAESGNEGVAIGNVLFGEVWVCAGQSNMGWSNFNRKDREAASADFPGLRYVAWHDSWYKPLDDIKRDVKWRECSPEAAQSFAAVPYLFGMFLHRYLKVPVGIINVARGGTLGQTWCLRGELDKVDNEIMRTVLGDYDSQTATWDNPAEVKRIVAEWKKACEDKKVEHAKKVAEAKAAGKKEPRLRLPKQPGDPRSGWSPPAGLFNATVMPIRKLKLRGVLYYQGENQAFNRWTRYEYTFPKIPVSFRKAFGEDDLWFGCISQPGWGTFGSDPESETVRGSYQVVRDIQQRALKGDKRAGMIATYPTGNSYIHPAEKLPVAEYASLWALGRVYDKPVVATGPTYREMKKKGEKIYLYFDNDPIVYNRWKHIKRNAYWQVLPCPREGNAEFNGFIIAGADRRFYPAKARHFRLDEVCCIEVWSDLVKDPVAVRYGWATWPTGNMVGRGRLPMPVFRTDDWPLPVGLSYSKEVAASSKKEQGEIQKQAELYALDRKMRQMQVDLPKLEFELHVRKSGNTKALFESKIARMQKIVDEMQKDEWVGRQLGGHAELAKQIEAAKAALEKARAAARSIEGK